MNILAIGDVVGEQGCAFLREKLPALKRWKGVDFCIANAENSAAGNGVTQGSAQALLESGVDFLTGGNHSYRRREVYGFLDENRQILRPANYYAGNPGRGFAQVDLGYMQLGIVNVSGEISMPSAENPFLCVEKILPLLKDCHIIVLDFHAEATSEKRGMGFFLDGKCAAVFGTHTHVQTADEQILPGGTGYITDLGMTGPKQSVLGVKPEIVIPFLKTAMPTRFDVAQGACMLNACLFDIDHQSGKCRSVERICLE